MKEDNNLAHDDAGERRIKVGITHGDFNGIGYEVILKTFDDNRILELCTPIVYGSAKIASYYRKGLELQGTQIAQIADASQARRDACNIINVIGQEAHIEPGASTAEAGQAAFAALERAVADLRSGAIDVLVTAPINKHNIQSDLFKFPGHTEYLEASVGDGARSLMILCSDRLRVALVTTHLPIARVASEITTEKILEKIEIFNHSLIQDYGIVKPRIAVLALNPHSGENGLLGDEEKNIIIPDFTTASTECSPCITTRDSPPSRP